MAEPGSGEIKDPRHDVAGAAHSPFDETPLIEGEIVDGTVGRGARGTGRFSVIGVVSSLGSSTAGSREVRALLTRPLRWLAILVLIPALISGLLGVAMDSGARMFAFVIAVVGILAASLLEVRRRALVGSARVPTTQTSAMSLVPDVRGLLGLLVWALFVTAIAVGFDLLAVLLIAFHVW